MSIVLISTMLVYEFNIVYGHETTYAPSLRSTKLSLRTNDELGGQLFLEHFDDRFTHEALDGKMIVGRHLMMDSILHY